MTGSDPTRVSAPKLPRPRASAMTRVLGSLFLIALAVAIAGAAGAFYAYDAFTRPGPLADKKVFMIGKGLSTPEIGAALEQAGIVSNGQIFAAAAWVTGQKSHLRAGEYEFAAAMPMNDVMDLIASGKSITYKISVPEGFTTDMALARVTENDVLTGEVTSPPPEGAIMPDTYVFERGATRQQLIDHMTMAEKKMVDEVWATRKAGLGIDTPEQAVILASIVEKETGIPEERGQIASVFLNRLKMGMRLQSDPTIIYGIVGGKGKLDRPLTKTDITTPTPYNTYTIKGLPPGPIANPGRAALEAVVNPPDTTYLYFVADGTGGHAFASTLEEHNRNVAKWRNLAGNSATALAAETGDAGQTDAGSGTTDVPEPQSATLPPMDTPVEQQDQTADATAAQPGAAATTTPAAEDAPVLDLKPGSVIASGDALIPVPKLKPRR
ncbi:endolytic transglycosylase MltG [Aestuariivirga sp.]|uniref:endolytic transglycosylase MltG n=1 Tax=Aestuariivirga sp. TaxID=2650926 RepID=UPI0039E3AC8A